LYCHHVLTPPPCFDTLPIDGVGKFDQGMVGVDDISQLFMVIEQIDGSLSLLHHFSLRNCKVFTMKNVSLGSFRVAKNGFKAP